MTPAFPLAAIAFAFLTTVHHMCSILHNKRLHALVDNMKGTGK